MEDSRHEGIFFRPPQRRRTFVEYSRNFRRFIEHSLDFGTFIEHSLDSGTFTEKMEDFPSGYPRVAAFLNSDADSRLYRRFGYLRNRLLLHRQDELVSLAEELAKMDKTDDSNPHRKYRLDLRREDEETTHCARKSLLGRIDKTLKDYDELLLREHTIMSIQEPSREAHRSYGNYIHNTKQLVSNELQFIYNRGDFVLLGDIPDRWLATYTGILVRVLWTLPIGVLNYLFTPREDGRKTLSSQMISKRVKAIVKAIVKAVTVVTTTVLLVLPIVILYLMSVHGDSGGVKIAVLLAWVVAFAFVLAAFTEATSSELFGASAGYCAVLIFFLGSGPWT